MLRIASSRHYYNYPRHTTSSTASEHSLRRVGTRSPTRTSRRETQVSETKCQGIIHGGSGWHGKFRNDAPVHKHWHSLPGQTKWPHRLWMLQGSWRVIEAIATTFRLRWHAKWHGHCLRECWVGMFGFTTFGVGALTHLFKLPVLFVEQQYETNSRREAPSISRAWHRHETGQCSNCGLMKRVSQWLSKVMCWSLRRTWTGDGLSQLGDENLTYQRFSGLYFADELLCVQCKVSQNIYKWALFHTCRPFNQWKHVHVWKSAHL